LLSCCPCFGFAASHEGQLGFHVSMPVAALGSLYHLHRAGLWLDDVHTLCV